MQSPKSYYPVINLLRGLAATLVCIFHFSNSKVEGDFFLSGGDWIQSIGYYGFYGVFIFFVISGFVIPVSMDNNNYHLSRLPKFLLRRWIRIELPYIASILAIIFFTYINGLIYMWNFEVDPMRILHHITYTIPFTDFEWYNVIFWTLAIEFQFYIMIALIYPLLKGKSTWLTFLVLSCFSYLVFLVEDHNLLFYYSPLFAYGIAVFLYKTKRINAVLLIAMSIMISIPVYYYHSIETLLFCLFTTVVILFFSVNTKFTNRFGEISYSLYLVHGIIGGNLIVWFAPQINSYPMKLGFLLLLLIASFISAYLFWWLIERPAQRLSKKISL